MAALRQNSAVDYLVMLMGNLGHAVPSFVIGPVLILVFAVWLRLLPAGGWDDFAPRYIVLPMALLVFINVATIGRVMRGSLIEVLHSNFIRTARAKGLPEFRLLMKYPMRMALNPFIADLGSELPKVISGSAVVAVVLSLQTSGPMLLDALRSQDQYLAGSFLMFLSLLAVIGTFISDLLLAALDPRIRLTGGAAK